MDHDNTPRTRRRLLKTGIAATGIASLGVLGSAPARAAPPVSGGGGALQTAIDNASNGDSIVVADSATYNPITIDESLTVTANRDPTIEGDGGTGAAVSIESDGVRFQQFTVTNPDGLLGIKVQEGYDDVAIHRNTVENVGPTGRLGVTGIVVGQGDHDRIGITHNHIKNLDQETTDDSGFPTVNGVLFDADNSDPGAVSNSKVTQNVIEDVESDVAPLGIVTQHELDRVDVVQNEIRNLVAADETDSDQGDSVDFEFTFAQGINVASPATKKVKMVGNHVSDITSAETILAEAVKIDGDGGGVTFRNNALLAAVGLNNLNGTDGGNRDPSGDPVIDAKANYWGSRRGPEEADFNIDSDDDDRADVIGNVEYEPFQRRPGKP
jgi:hypothetical protein